MARRHPPPDPELAALARDRLARLLGGGTDGAAGPRRAAGAPDPSLEEVPDDEPGARWTSPSSPGHRVETADLEPPRRFTRWHLGVVAAVLLVGLVWGGWSWLRARPEAVAAPAVVQSGGPGSGPTPAAGLPEASAAGSAVPDPAGSPGAGGGSGQAAGAVGPVVHVLGAVRHPGLVRLEVGARVEDALEAAGGLQRDADPDELNLAQPLEDGVQVVVGTKAHPAGEVRAAGGGGSGGGSAGGGARSTSGGATTGATLDLNQATVDQLDTLPDVGPVTAQKILDWREQHGRFSGVEELQEVDGIGPKTYARLAPLVRV